MYKRIWPATQRDSLFWSHIRRLDSREYPGVDPSEGVVLDTWMAVNYSTRFGDDRIPPSSTPFIRLEVDVEMFCQTIWKPPHDLAERIEQGSIQESEWDEIRRTKVVCYYFLSVAFLLLCENNPIGGLSISFPSHPEYSGNGRIQYFRDMPFSDSRKPNFHKNFRTPSPLFVLNPFCRGISVHA